MPDVHNVSPGANGARLDLSNAPGGDLEWDSLFPNPELAAQQPQVAQGTNQQPSSQTPQNSGPFLKAGDTVYNTADDAIQGTVHKDQLIARYRNFLTEQGIDPNTMQSAARPNQPQVQPQVQQQPATSQYKLYGNPDFFEQVAKAAATGDKVAYERIMSSHAREAAQVALEEQLAPWRSTLAETNRFRAIRQATSEVPEFQKFIEGPGYKKVLDSFPLYKEMVQIGENDPVAAQRLPEVYKSMYLIYQGMNQPQAGNVQATPQNTPTVRSQPTLQPSSLTPPAPSQSTQGWSQPSSSLLQRGTNDARKALIEDGNRKFQGSRFEDLGL